MPEKLMIAKGREDHVLLPEMANRHGLIVGPPVRGKPLHCG